MPTPSEVVAERVKTVRRRRGLKVAQLAERCAKLGMPALTAQSIFNIETTRPGRPQRPVTVDELLTLAAALDVAPVNLLTPTYPAAHTSYDTGPGPNDEAPYQVTAEHEHPVYRVRQFIRGNRPLEGMDTLAFFSEAAAHERDAAQSLLKQWTEEEWNAAIAKAERLAEEREET